MKTLIRHIFSLIALYAIVLAGSNDSYCQDIHFSQFENSPLNLNPAYTGQFDGDLRFTGLHRKQWKSVTVPYNTFSGSFDMGIEPLSQDRARYSAGILLNNDKAGDSDMGLMQAAVSFSLQLSIDDDSIHFISAGIQAGYVLRSIKYQDLTFDEQYNGDIFNPATGNNENFAGDNHGYFDLSVGIGYVFRHSAKFKTGAGISMQHINRPADSFFDQKIKMFPRYQADLKADGDIGEKFSLIPSVILMNQGGYNELTGGTSVRYRLSSKPGKSYSLYLGGFLRSKDAFIASAGLDYNTLHAGISYDFNTSDLQKASDGKGGFELSVIYIIRKVKPIAIKPPCPLY